MSSKSRNSRPRPQDRNRPAQRRTREPEPISPAEHDGVFQFGADAPELAEIIDIDLTYTEAGNRKPRKVRLSMELVNDHNTMSYMAAFESMGPQQYPAMISPLREWVRSTLLDDDIDDNGESSLDRWDRIIDGNDRDPKGRYRYSVGAQAFNEMLLFVMQKAADVFTESSKKA